MGGRLSSAGEAGFEGSCLGDCARPPRDARPECEICWEVYEPADGDPQWQVPPGTPFGELSPRSSCPQCEGSAYQFMVLP